MIFLQMLGLKILQKKKIRVLKLDTDKAIAFNLLVKTNTFFFFSNEQKNVNDFDFFTTLILNYCLHSTFYKGYNIRGFI